MTRKASAPPTSRKAARTLAGAAVFAIPALAVASPNTDLLLNGDFSNGLEQWNVRGDVVAQSGAAVISERDGSLTSALSQSFSVTGSLARISFDLEFESTGDNNGSLFNDSLFVTLLDAATLQPIVNNPGTDDFLFIDADGVSQSVQQRLASNGATFTLDLFGIPLAGRDLLLGFQLAGFDDGRNSSVRIDNVSAVSRVIPLPGPALLAAAGVVAVAAPRRRRDRD